MNSIIVKWEVQYDFPVNNVINNDGTRPEINLIKKGLTSIKTLKKEYFSQPKHVIKLDISENLLEDLTELYVLSKLKILNASKNIINKLYFPSCNSFVWEELIHLNVSNNKISKLHEKTFTRTKVLKNLFIGHNKISVLPKNLFDNLCSLQCLDISNNQIKDLNENVFEKLEALEVLNLRNNKIERLNESLFKKSKCLKVLNISNNSISELSDRTFNQMKNLKELCMENNKITVLPENLFNNICLLQHLDISNNQIKELNVKVFEKLEALEVLYLWNNKIERLNESLFKKSKCLKVLNISNNLISELSDRTFNQMKNLKELYMGNNKISVLPENLFNNICLLQHLDISNNQITELKDNAFNKLMRLIILNISNNPLVRFQESIKNLHSIKDLYLSTNRICDLDRTLIRKLNSLNILNISRNGYKVLYEEFFIETKNLSVLSLASNEIENLHEKQFETLENLQDLDISDNRLKELNENLFKNLGNLKKLNLSHNNIDKFNGSLFYKLSALEILMIAHNQLGRVDKQIFNNLKKLKFLDLSHNKIEKIINSSFDDLNELSILNLSNNKISELSDKTFAQTEKLLQLSFSNNKITGFSENLFNNLRLLQILQIENNDIKELDLKTFSNLISLKCLNLTSNKITKLNRSLFVNLKGLILLDISNNYLEELENNLFDDLLNIEWLNIASNQIKNFDKACFNKLEKLSVLNISNNNLSAINACWFTKLKNLSSLDISCNDISNIEIKDFLPLKKLETLNMFKNKLTKFTFNLESLSIIRLDLSSNQLSEISYGVNQIEILKLNNNKIKNLDLSNFKNIQEIFLNGNNLVDIKNNSKSLKCLHIYENSFNEQKIIEIENNFNNLRDLKVRFLFSLDQHGYVKSINNGNINDLIENSEIKLNNQKSSLNTDPTPIYLGPNRFQGFTWDEIPMFAVITGVNGIGKTSLIRHIYQKLEISYKNTINRKDGIIVPILIEEQEEAQESTFFDQLLQEDVLYYLNKYKGSRLLDQSMGFKYRNQASIISFKSVETCLKYLKKDIEELSCHLRNENFKYTKIKAEDENYFLVCEKTNSKVKLGNLSPGEKLILLLLVWQFIFNSYEVYGRTILLFDEPDAHLHPSAVHELIKILKKLVHLGIQVIFTSHNPITVNFINDENLFLLYEEKNKLKIRKGSTKHELSSALTSQLVNIEKPSKTLVVEGKDAEFYQKIKTILNKTEIYSIPFHFQINIISLNDGLRNKSVIKQTLKAIKSFQTFYGIVDDDGDNDCEKIDFIENLFYLKRYAKENYILDPVNVYFFLKNRPPKNDDVKSFIKKIQKKIADKIGKDYSDYSLNKILDYIFSNEIQKVKSIQVLELIIAEFYESMKMQAIDLVINGNVNSVNLFCLPLIFINYTEQKIANNFNKESIVKKLYTDLLVKLKENMNDLKVFIDQALIDFLKKIKSKHRNINEAIESELEKENGQTLKSICKDTFSKLESALDAIQKETKINFDLNKICNQTIGDKKLIGKIKYDGKSFSPGKFLKIKNLVDDIKTLAKYENFEIFSSEDNAKQRIELNLKEEKKVHVNRNEIIYPNFFVSFNAHALEKLYNNVFPNCSIQCKEILNVINVNGMIIPDELVYVFRNLCNSIIEIKEEIFEWTVFNSSKNWFIKFTNNSNELDEFLLKAFVLF